jgi:hypothetical protein
MAVAVMTMLWPGEMVAEAAAGLSRKLAMLLTVTGAPPSCDELLVQLLELKPVTV